MSSLLVRNLDDDIIAQFKALAMQRGLSVEAFHRQTIINLVENKAELQPRNLNEVLLKLPKLEQMDEVQAIFERDSSVGRDVELGD
ncbi:FitA-like ribbon-helix-helix domain-containing protein [Alkanindiges illinoisensis]|uniref:FitA-like ribbon-helix-helix domain-containing protein n=1 Tax=Alkanindiges illinoisensis TaxID=197183 RepID=UPI0005523552|nr:hypothetical protein [Alkanindiges illinoisensis]